MVTSIQVSPLKAQEYLYLENLCIHNFASGANPGGGWRRHSCAQEESLCNSSNLGLLLEAMGHHDFYRGQPSINTDHHFLFPVDFWGWKKVSVLSMAQVNMSSPLFDTPENREISRQRIFKVVEIAESTNCKTFVTGPWGCGVYKNPPLESALAWKEALEKSSLRNVVFACGSKDSNYEIFKKVFHG